MPRLWLTLIGLGVSPAGPNVRFQRWPELFDFSGEEPLLKPADSLDAKDRALLDELELEIRKASWRAVSGRLLYDIETKGLGYFALSPSTRYAPPANIPQQSFAEICSSVIRILLRSSLSVRIHLMTSKWNGERTSLTQDLVPRRRG